MRRPNKFIFTFVLLVSLLGNALFVAPAYAAGSIVFTSADNTTFTVGIFGEFSITATASSTVSISITAGSLPSGVTLLDNGRGAVSLSGTPAVGTGGTYPLTFTASDGVDPDATQSFTLTVNESSSSPAITSANTTTFAAGSFGTFTVTTANFSTTPAFTVTFVVPSTPAGLTFVDNGDGTATLSGTPATSGTYQYLFTVSNGSQTISSFLILTVSAAATSPAITSADNTLFVVNMPGSFTVTTTAGVPSTTSISETGSLPAGVSFIDNGDGTATLSGSPTAGSSGTYPLTITASNGAAPDATQSFTLTVADAPVITSADNIIFTVGGAGAFEITATGSSPITITQSGSLPRGVTFTDTSGGIALLYGTPAPGTGGVYPLTITASNGVGDTTQSFILTVDESPLITSIDNTAFTIGSFGTFNVTTSGAPTVSTITATSSPALPASVSFVNNGDGTATLSGTPLAGDEGVYILTISANNGLEPDIQTFTLTIGLAPTSPAITSADHAAFTIGSAGTFTVTTSGIPTVSSIGETGSLPDGVTFVDNSNGTATLSGTPTAGSAGTYPLTLTASNGIAPDAAQSFTLTVSQAPAITSADNTAFTVGSAGTFTVTTTGFSSAPTITASSTPSLPASVTFVNNGDGTATLSGTPLVGDSGTYVLQITADASLDEPPTQSFTLVIGAGTSPVITSSDNATFAVGSAGTFTVTTSGIPVVTSVGETGSLPGGVSFTDNGDGTATLSGTPAAGSGGVYSLTFSASNGVAPDAAQSFTLTVTEDPAITSADNATFVVGSAGTFTVTTNAYPAVDFVSQTGSLPGGVTFTDNGDGTATLSGTPTSGSSGVYPITITAGNSRHSAIQSFTLTIINDSQPTVISNQSYQIKYDTWFGVSDSHAFGGGYREAVKGKFTFQPDSAFTTIKLITYRGPDQGRAKIIVDGVVKKTLDLYSPTPQWQYIVTLSGLKNTQHTVVVKALKARNGHSSGKWVRVDGFEIGATTYDDNQVYPNQPFTYGSWVGLTQSGGPLSDDYRISTMKNATISFSFDGSGVTWVTALGPTYGKAAIYVDGVLTETVNLYSHNQQWQHKVTISGLANGHHTILIKVLGKKNLKNKSPHYKGTGVVCDGFEIN